MISFKSKIYTYVSIQYCFVNNTFSFLACAIGLKIDRGIIQVNAWSENMVLDLASVKCDTGYVPSQLEVICQASGQWQPATCNRCNVFNELISHIVRDMFIINYLANQLQYLNRIQYFIFYIKKQLLHVHAYLLK
jgi:hypothetical protein